MLNIKLLSLSIRRKAVIGLALFMHGTISFSQNTIVHPHGHTQKINSLNFSSDNEYILSSSSDNSIKLWNINQQRLVRTFLGHSSAVSNSIFKNNHKTIASISQDGNVIVWDFRDGAQLLKLHYKELLQQVAFHPINGNLAIVNGDSLHVWDIEYKKKLFSCVHQNSINYFSFSPDGMSIFTVSNDNMVYVWDAMNGTQQNRIKSDLRAVNSVVSNKDGKVITWSKVEGRATLFDLNNNKVLKNINVDNVLNIQPLPSSDEWSIVNRNILSVWDETLNNETFHLEFDTPIRRASLDSKSNLMTLQFKSKVVVVNLEEKAIISEYIANERISFSILNPKDSSIFLGYNSGRIEGVNYLDLKSHVDLRSHVIDPVSQVLRRNNESYTVDFVNSNAIYQWDITNRNTEYFEINNISKLDGMLISKNGEKIILRTNNELFGIDFFSKKCIDSLSFMSNSSSTWRPVAMSEHGDLIVVGIDDSLFLYSYESNFKLLRKIKTIHHEIWSVNISKDGSFIVVAGADESDNSITVYETNSLSQTNRFFHSRGITNVQVNPVEKQVVFCSLDSTLVFWDLDKNSSKYILKGHQGQVVHAEFNESGSKLLSIGTDNNVLLWDVQTRKVIHTLTGHYAIPTSVSFSSDDKYILTTGNDFVSIVWDALTGKKVYTRLQLEKGDWLVYDEYYRYDGTPGARDYLYFVCGLEVIDLAQVKDALYVPNLVQRIMQGQDINYPKLSELTICDAFPVIEQGKGDRGEFLYEITPRNLGLKEVEVYVNSKRVAVVQKEQMERESTKFMLRLNESDLQKHFLSGAANTVEVIGVVEDGGVQLRSRGSKSVFEAEEKDATPPTIYGVFVGVKNYKDPALNLGFPAKDAQDLRHAFSLSAKKFLGEANVETYLLHNDFELGGMDGAPQRESIRKTLEDIGKKAKPQDAVLLFFAGHGEMQGNDEKYFTLLTEEAGKNNFTGISTKDLTSWLSYDGPHKMLANKTILILDACNSGQATKELMAMARNDDESRRIRQVEDLKDKSGMFIFAASAANQAAYEMPQYQQGLLTYSLLHTLKNDASVLDEGGLLNLQKWFLQSERYLKEMVERHGLQQQAQPFGTANIDIAKVDDEVRNAIILVGEKATVVLENVLNTAIGLDDLDLKGQLAQELSSISQRGTSSINFVQQNITDAYKINIVYTTKDGKLDATLRLVKGKSIVFEQTYKKMTTEELLEGIVKDVKLNAVKE